MTLPVLSAADQVGVPLLTLIIAVPVAAAATLWFSPGRAAPRRLAALAASVQLALAVLVGLVFRTDHAGLQLAESFGPWRLGIDGISVLFLPLTALLTLLCVLATGPRDWTPDPDGLDPAPEPDEPRYLAALLALSAILTAAFCAADARLYWLFLTLEAAPAWYLVARFGGGGLRRAAARDFLVVMGLAAGLSLIGIELLAGLAGGSGLDRVAAAEIPAGSQGATFVLLVLAFAVRAPLFPLHGWLPRILEHGPVMGLGVFLVGLKVGTYGLLRLVIGPLPEAAAQWGWIVAALGGAGAIYAGVMALIQTDLRRLLAFASVAHMGVIVIGLFSLNAHGIEGGLLQMLTIGMAVAGLYILAAFIADRVGQPDLRNLGALASRTPFLAGAFLLTALAAVGMPGTSGFNGEHLVVIGAYEAHPVLALLVAASIVLTAAYLLRFFQRAFMDDPLRPEVAAGLGDLRPAERGVAGALAAAVLVVGLWTGPFISLARASVEALAARMPEAGAAAVQAVTDPARTVALAAAGGN